MIGGRQNDPDPVELDGVRISYGRSVVLDGVSLRIPHGVTALLGHNGAGKSSLLRVVAGVQHPASGAVLRAGEDTRGSRATEVHRARTGWLPQRPGLPGSVSARRFVEYVAWHRLIPPDIRAAETDRVLELTSTASLSERRIGTLSGGQRQRVALAAALLGSPDLLLLDEPTAGLDPGQRDTFYRAVQQVVPRCAVVLSTHLIEDVLAVAKHLVVVRQGGVEGPIPLADVVDPRDPAGAMSLLRSMMGPSA